jgi:cytochrome c oxidase subunit 2
LFRRRAPRIDPLATDKAGERRIGGVVMACTALTAVTVIALTVLSYASQRRLFAKQGDAVNVRVIGHQWWWEVRYEDPRVDRSFITANEIHVPVNRPVTVKLESSDVIHSFWVPNLMGKMDNITGQQNQLQFVAAHPGVYRGQCAEFCGFQHAHMAILVIASPQAEFDAWRDVQIKSAETPTDPEQQRGRDIFLNRSCVLCHTVRGTPAASNVGPDLTHVASRRTLAAGALPTSRGNFSAWIADPQGIKPGSNMPITKLAPDELNAVSAYLMALK